ncbi:MAG: hypothetical protein LAT65_13280 [Saccharospirillum sp.]|nr:hypothetical protein [Saccharospirillum sp.]
MTTLFSHFLAQVLGCSSIEAVHNRVRSHLVFVPDHGFSQAEIDAFILEGTEDTSALARWSQLLRLDPDLLADAASLARRSVGQQHRRLPELRVQWVGTQANMEPSRQVAVRIRVELADHPQAERLRHSGQQWFERQTGYTFADLNRPGAFERILSLANDHWQQLEQWSGVSAESIDIELSPV